ncbi:MAG: transporter substrate-binding domain-containing protein [Bacteroidales bacterium]|nr:transporter substrate-binding domain-containing protein [Bacteroidales bacterium]
MPFRLKYLISVSLVVMTVSLPSCLDHNRNMEKLHNKEGPETDRILRKIKERGKIIALLDNNPTDYFIYRGTPVGYHYDLIRQFAKHLEVELEIQVSDDLEKSFEWLEKEKCDILAMGLTITKNRKENFSFTDPLFETRQVLVQRKKKLVGGKDSIYISSPLKLGGKTLHIQKSATVKNRITSLSEEIGEDIFVVEHDHANVEELIAMVARGEIDYTVAKEHIARVNCMYYEGLETGPYLSLRQNLGWAVKKDANGLLGVLNQWLSGFKGSKLSVYLYGKYFKSRRPGDFTGSSSFSPVGGKISVYDDIIRKYSREYGWDWLLVASLIYQESRFDPHITSWAGAFGLMQIMPGTARRFGIDSLSSPGEQIKAGIEILNMINGKFEQEIPDKKERRKFVLASYNAGIAHVYDARRLAVKYGKNPNLWTGHVDSFMLRKEFPDYFNDSVVKFGYCKGSETFNFVNEVLERFNHYKNLIPADPE